MRRGFPLVRSSRSWGSGFPTELSLAPDWREPKQPTLAEAGKGAGARLGSAPGTVSLILTLPSQCGKHGHRQLRVMSDQLSHFSGRGQARARPDPVATRKSNNVDPVFKIVVFLFTTTSSVHSFLF